jgi:predicted Zn-dependent protease
MRRLSIMKGTYLRLTLLPVLVFVFVACQTNPATGRLQFNMVGMEQEIAMGQEAHQQIGVTMGIYEDAELERYVAELGEAMAATSELPDLPWTFRVVDDPTVNAFALPGGFVYFTRGILAHFNNEAELAAVMGHEIAHVTARHGTNRLSQMQIAQLGIGLAMVLEPELQRFAPLAGIGMQLLFLSFNRGQEHEADRLGVRYMTNLDYDPRSMIDVMETLRRASEAAGAARLPEWLATHPHPENRAEEILSHIEVEVGPEARDWIPPGQDRYLQQIDGMVYGPDPRQGYTRNGTFHHPELRFSMTFPPQWRIINQRQAVIGLNADRDASVQLTISDQASIEAAARQLYDIEQVEGAGIQRTQINGLPAGVGDFTVRSQQGVIQGTAAFIEYEGRIYQLLGYSGANVWQTHQQQLRSSIQSFSQLTDRRALQVEPLRIDVVRLDGAMTLQQLYDQYYGATGPVPLSEIALINQVEPEDLIAAGTSVKMVRGTLP